MNYVISASLAFGLSLSLTPLIKSLAKRAGIIDKPDKIRKFHEHATPLLGGLAIFFSFFLVLSFYLPELIAGNLDVWHWLGFFLGGLIIIVGGVLDDRFDLSPKTQLIFPLLAIVVVLISGIGIEKITNPLGGGFIRLDAFSIQLFSILGHDFIILPLSSLLIFVWLLGMMYTTKLLDGMDGLVTGVTMIGAFIIFLFTITERYYQPDIALASLILAFACLGFLVFNWHPASIFLGEGGSLFLGYALGVLAIISGGKFAVALLVMGIPVLDVAWTIYRRLRAGKNPFKFSDRGHLHFRILDTGIGQRKTAIIYYLIAASFGLSTLFLQSRGKLLALFCLLALMAALLFFFRNQDKS
jgi:UDP-GlcNAc:undecaprenyl-phosphate GlcNAc-1-phosphate transferase